MLAKQEIEEGILAARMIVAVPPEPVASLGNVNLLPGTADAVGGNVLLLGPAAQVLCSEWGVSAERVLALIDGVNSDDFRPLSREEARRTLNLPQDRTLAVFLGVLAGPHHGPHVRVIELEHPDAVGSVAGLTPRMAIVVSGHRDRPIIHAHSGGWVVGHGRLPSRVQPLRGIGGSKWRKRAIIDGEKPLKTPLNQRREIGTPLIIPAALGPLIDHTRYRHRSHAKLLAVDDVLYWHVYALGHVAIPK